MPLLSLSPYNLAGTPDISVSKHSDKNLEAALRTVLECYDFSNSSILQANLNGLHFGLRGVVPKHTPAPIMKSIKDFIKVLQAYVWRLQYRPAMKSIKDFIKVLQAYVRGLQDNPAMESIADFINVLQAYIHVNNLNIDSETLGNFNIHFRPLNGKNLLQLAGDRRNTKLVSCICNRIYNPRVLRRLSKATSTETSSNGRMYDTLQYNDEIRRTIETRYWGLCLFLGGALTTVGIIFQSTISALLTNLTRLIFNLFI